MNKEERENITEEDPKKDWWELFKEEKPEEGIKACNEKIENLIFNYGRKLGKAEGIATLLALDPDNNSLYIKLALANSNWENHYKMFSNELRDMMEFCDLYNVPNDVFAIDARTDFKNMVEEYSTRIDKIHKNFKDTVTCSWPRCEKFPLHVTTFDKDGNVLF